MPATAAARAQVGAIRVILLEYVEGVGHVIVKGQLVGSAQVIRAHRRDDNAKIGTGSLLCRARRLLLLV